MEIKNKKYFLIKFRIFGKDKIIMENYNLNNEIVKRNTKSIYRDNDKTIKLFIEKYSKSDILNEALNQSRIEENTDLKISKLKEVTKINNRWALVSEYIEGKSLESLMSENPEKMEEYLDLFIDIQLEILSKKVPLLNRMKEKYRRRIDETDLIDDNIKYELLQRLAGMDSHRCVCHGDFNPSNIIITEKGEHYVIDWAHVTQGNASGDSAMTYLLFCKDGKKELAEKYLTRFAEKSGIEKNEIQKWIPIVAANQLTKEIKEEEDFLRNWIDVVEF